MRPGKKDPLEADTSAAFAPVPEPVEPRRYKVVGALPVLDTEPGETFVATLPPEQEALLLGGGHIVRVGGPLKSESE